MYQPQGLARNTSATSGYLVRTTLIFWHSQDASLLGLWKTCRENVDCHRSQCGVSLRYEKCWQCAIKTYFSRLWRQRHYISRSSTRPSVNDAISPYFFNETWHIHRVDGHCWKGFKVRVQKSRSYAYKFACYNGGCRHFDSVASRLTCSWFQAIIRLNRVITVWISFTQHILDHFEDECFNQFDQYNDRQLNF